MKKFVCVLLSALLALGLFACGDSGEAGAAAGLQVGYAKVNTTPSYDVGLGGYSDAETRTQEGMVEPVFLTCIAVTSGQETILMYTLDMCGLSRDQTNNLRDTVAMAVKVPATNVFIGTTHSHNSPSLSGYDNSGKYMADYMRYMVEGATLALADQAPATFHVASAEHEGMNFVRHYILDDGTYVPNAGANGNESRIVGHPMPTDQQMTLLKFDRQEKKDILMVNWQTHPDSASTIGYYMISPSFIGPMRNKLETDSGMLVAYFSGAVGNQTPTSKWEEENHKMDWSEYGQALADCASAMLDTFQPVEGIDIKVINHTENLQVDHSWDHMLQEANEVYAVWKSKGKEAGDTLGATYGFTSSYQARAIRSRAAMGPTIAMDMNVFCIGEIGFATSSYEMFSDNGIFIKENSPYAHTFMISTTSSYMPSDVAYTYRGYEQDTTFYARGSAEQMADKYVELLNRLKQ